jgi:hypothetical protein
MKLQTKTAMISGENPGRTRWGNREPGRTALLLPDWRSA